MKKKIMHANMPTFYLLETSGVSNSCKTHRFGQSTSKTVKTLTWRMSSLIHNRDDTQIW